MKKHLVVFGLVGAVIIISLQIANAARRFSSYMDAIEHLTLVIEQIEKNTRK
jgi:hypothetical protein